MPSQEIGIPIPDNTPHAISVTLPTWEATIGYEEGQDWVVSKMNSGYPRFFIHSSIKQLCTAIESKYGREGEQCLVFPTYNVAKRCREFIKSKATSSVTVRVLQLSTRAPLNEYEKSSVIEANVGVVFFPRAEFPLAKAYWQHLGEGISSRMGEYLYKELIELQESESSSSAAPGSKNGRPYRRSSGGVGPAGLKSEQQAKLIQQRSPSISKAAIASASSEVDTESDAFIEQKFGRVLDLKFADQAKIALRRRISGKADKSQSQEEEMSKAKRGKHLSETDVYLFPSGMASIFNCHRALLDVADASKKSVCFGFPYVDTMNILRKFGAGVIFLGFGDDASLDVLEKDLEGGLEIMGLFCECPSNPLLKTPDLKRIRMLADKYNFAVVVDETVGNFLNVHVLEYADMVASSLTKVFSGASNVMAGSIILNPTSKLYPELKQFFDEHHEETFWAEDALYLERNSRDFAERSAKINDTTTATVEALLKCELIAKVYYPSISESKKHYDAIKTANGGYGGLLSFLFHKEADAKFFFNYINIHKGPSLGTNFTLACPYAILAHYDELDYISGFGVDRNIIRISMGLEDKEDILARLQESLDATAAQST